MLTALTTNTVTPTILQAGAKTNVIPSIAEAQLDCRKLPGQTSEDVMREILAITGSNVSLEPIQVTSGTEFPTDTPFYQLLESVTHKMDPQGIVVPLLMVGATDACVYQQAGITMYGFTPGILPAGFPMISLGHGHDERLPVSFIESGLPTLWDMVYEFCT